MNPRSNSLLKCLAYRQHVSVRITCVRRSLDLILDALESDPSNRGLLRLVDNFKRDSVPHVVGFKLGHYRDAFVGKVHRARAREALNKKVPHPQNVEHRI